MRIQQMLLRSVGSSVVALALTSIVTAAAYGAQGSDLPRCDEPRNLAPFEPVVAALGKSGIHVLQVCRSKLEATFVPPNATALVYTDAGAFELVVFENEGALATLRATSTSVVEDGRIWYRTTLSGIETRPSPFTAEGTQDMRFLVYRNTLVITYDCAIEKRVGEALAASDAPRPAAAPN
jgi:hypothetical protein